MGLFREPLRDILARVDAAESENENVIPFEARSPQRQTEAGADLVSLVLQAAETIRSREDQAAERDAKTQALVQGVVDELRLAKEQALMTAAKVRELQDFLTQRDSVIAATQARMLTIENHAQQVEARAQRAEYALRCVEDAIRTKLLTAVANSSSNSAAA